MPKTFRGTEWDGNSSSMRRSASTVYDKSIQPRPSTCAPKMKGTHVMKSCDSMLRAFGFSSGITRPNSAGEGSREMLSSGPDGVPTLRVGADSSSLPGSPARLAPKSCC